MGIESGDVSFTKNDPAGGRTVDTGDGTDQRGLARTVGPNNRDDLPSGHVERHSSERLSSAIIDIEIPNFEQRAHKVLFLR